MNRRLLITALSGLAAACSPLSLLNSLAPRDPARQGPFGIEYGQDPRQRMDLYAPANLDGRRHPLLVFFYGGAWNSGRRQDYGWVGQALASRGFVTVIPDHRLAPAHPFPAFVEDGAAAVAAACRLAADHGGDPDRIVLAGHSSGAYIASMLTLDPRWLSAAGVDPRRVRAFAGLSGPYDFYPFDVKASIEAFGEAPDPRMTQPVNLDLSSAPPVFLAHGGRDETVRVRNSESLARALTAAGADCDLKIYPPLDHKDVVLALSRPFRDRAPVLDDMTRFLHAHAG